jgi:hypothetical protein
MKLKIEISQVKKIKKPTCEAGLIKKQDGFYFL